MTPRKESEAVPDRDDCQHVWISMSSEATRTDAMVCLKCNEWRPDDE